MKCANCGAETSPGAKFCTSCGSPAPAGAVCAHCGAELMPGTQFCTSCGKPVVAVVGTLSHTPDVSHVPPPETQTAPAPPTYQPLLQPQQIPPYVPPQAAYQADQERREGAPPILFWVCFGILALLALVFYGFGGVPIVGWAVLLICLVGLFLLRSALLRRGLPVTIGAYLGVLVILFLTLGLAGTSSDSKSTASGGTSTVPASAPSASGAAASSSKPAAAPTTAPAAKPAPTTGLVAGPKVSTASFGLGQTPDMKITNPTSTFKPDTPEIFLSLETSGVAGDTAVDVTWIYVGTGDSVKGPTQRINADARVGFSLSKPTAGWAAGQYKVVILLNGKEAASPTFTVQK